MDVPRRCARGKGCREFQPCPTHGTSNWANSTTRPLPGNWSALKKAVIRRDGKKCRVCSTSQNLELDHVIPRSKGGSDKLENLALLCRFHHRIKTQQDKKK